MSRAKTGGIKGGLGLAEDTSDAAISCQQVLQLAGQAESTLDVLNIDEETQKLLDAEIICSMFEGNAPYRPRYIIPDYKILMEKGCKFLDLDVQSNTSSLMFGGLSLNNDGTAILCR